MNCNKCGKAIGAGKFCRECLMRPVEQDESAFAAQSPLLITAAPETASTPPMRVTIVDEKSPSLASDVLTALSALAWVATVGGAGIALLLLVETFNANGAPQQGALAAMACAFVVIPYCVARAFSSFAEIIRQ